MAERSDCRATFEVATDWFVSLVELVRGDQWDAPGLGVWSVRDLVGHTARALSTLERYLGEPAEQAAVGSSAEYFRIATTRPGAHDAIAKRGREAGAALGDDPTRAVRELAGRARARLATASDDTAVPTPAGAMRLADYLPTRTAELIVHGLDLAAAIGASDQSPPQDAALESLHVLVEVHPERAPKLLRGLAGRGSLPEGFNLLG